MLKLQINNLKFSIDNEEILKDISFDMIVCQVKCNIY